MTHGNALSPLQSSAFLGDQTQDIVHRTISRVLTIVTNLGKGGVQRTAQLFAQGYRELGIDSRVLAVHEGGEREQYLSDAGIPFWIGTTPKQFSDIRDWDPELIHVHAHRISSEDISELLTSLPHSILVEKNVFSAPTPFSTHASCSFQMSRWCQWRFRRHRHSRGVRTALIPNVADPSAFFKSDPDATTTFRTSHNIPPDAFLIGRIGQADAGKWSPLLLTTFSALCTKNQGRRIYLLLVNPPKTILAQLDSCNFRDRVTVIERIQGDAQLRVAYSSMDVFALTADCGESFGNVLAESLLCKTPVVALSTPWSNNSQCEVVGHNVGGLIATTPRGFAQAIQMLMDDAKLRGQLGVQGRSHIIKNYHYLQGARSALDAALGNHQAFSQRELNRSILQLYVQAVDGPNALTALLVKWGILLPLTRYTTGYGSVGDCCSRLSRKIRLRTSRILRL